MNKQVTRKDDSGASIVVEGPNSLTQWKTADEWQNTELPIATGIYEIFCHDGKSTTLPAVALEIAVENKWEDWHKERAMKDCGNLQGIVYIGMTTSIKNRFGILVKSWENYPSIKNLHGSRKKWNKDASIQHAYPIANMLFRFMRLGSIKEPVSSTTTQIKNNNVPPDLVDLGTTLWLDKGTNHYDPSASAGIAYEDKELKKYIQCFKQLPVLNTDGPEGGYPATEESLQDYFGWQEKQEDQEELT